MTTAVPRRLCWGHQLCLSISQALQFGRLEPLVTTYHQSQIVTFHLFLSPLSPPLHLNWGSIPQFTLGPSLLPPRRRALVNKYNSASFESVECSPLHQPAPLPFSNNLGFLFGQAHRLGSGDFHIPGSRDTGTQTTEWWLSYSRVQGHSLYPLFSSHTYISNPEYEAHKAWRKHWKLWAVWELGQSPDGALPHADLSALLVK